MQAELQSEGEAIGEGEDSVVEAAAVTGVHIRNFRLQVMPHLLTKSKILYHRISVSVVYRSCSHLKIALLCTGYHVCTPGSAVKQLMADEIYSPALTSATCLVHPQQ